MSPQEAFIRLIIAAMQDAAENGAMTQFQSQINPSGRPGGEKVVRIIVVPEQLPRTWPASAPLGADIGQG